MPPTIPELASIGAAHAPQISATLDAQLELDGFETATIADLPTKQAQIDMGMVQREPLDSCEEDWEIDDIPLNVTSSSRIAHWKLHRAAHRQHRMRFRISWRMANT